MAGAILVGDRVDTDSIGSVGRWKWDTCLADCVKCVDSLLGGGGRVSCLMGTSGWARKLVHKHVWARAVGIFKPALITPVPGPANPCRYLHLCPSLYAP